MGGKMSATADGYIKYRVEHEWRDLDAADVEAARSLLGWRLVLRRVGLIGRDPVRYDGAGYGNLSVRLGPGGAFLVTATQTSGLESVGPGHFCRVESCDPRTNRLISRGPALPSAESMTHAAAYGAGPAVGCVLHAHSPEIWGAARELGIPVTDPGAAYGTPEMAEEVGRLVRAIGARTTGVLAMGGHEDGVLAWGGDPAVAGSALLAELAAACSLSRSFLA